MIEKPAYCKKLVLLLWERKINQTQLAKDTGISRSWVNQIVNGRVIPTQEEMDKIANALCLNVNELFKE